MNISNICSIYKDRIFVTDYEKNISITYRELYNHICFYRNILNLYVKKNDNVVVFIGNYIEYQIAFFSILVSGGISTPLNPEIPIDSIKEYLDIVNAEVILCRNNDENKLKEQFPTYRIIPIERIERIEDLNFTLQNYETNEFLINLFTSGSTGNPKCITLKTNPTIESFSFFGSSFNLNSDSVIIQCMPMYHADGWCFSTLMPFIFGCRIILLPVFNARLALNFDKILESYNNVTFICTPFMLQTLVNVYKRYKVPYKKKMKHVICGSQSLERELRLKFENIFSTAIYDNYGLTETLLIAFENPNEIKVEGSVGKIIDKCFVRLSNLNEIQVKTPYIASNYLGADPKIFLSKFDGDYFCTGDTGYINSDGYLFITGRLNNIINRGGIKIDAEQIDKYILEESFIDDSITFSTSDDISGLKVYSCCTLDSNKENVTSNDIWEVVQRKLPKEFWPDEIRIVDNIPRNEIGKVNLDKIIAKLNLS